MSGELLGYKLIGLRQAIDSLELEFAQTAADFARTNEYDEQGSTYSLVRANSAAVCANSSSRLSMAWRRPMSL